MHQYNMYVAWKIILLQYPKVINIIRVTN